MNAYNDSNLTQLVYSNYFESATFNYNSTPNTLVVTNSLASTPNYPFKSPVWIPLEDGELKTTPMIKGHVDYLGNIYKDQQNSQEKNSPFDKNKRDTFLDTYSLSRKDFDLDKTFNNQYYITGSDLNTFKNISGLAEEYIWFNGVKMDKNYDYQKISCLSLKNTDKFTSKQGQLIWDTDLLGFYTL